MCFYIIIYVSHIDSSFSTQHRRSVMRFRRNDPASDSVSYEEESRRADENRKSFLQSSHAVLTPPIWYAAWLAIYVVNGGRVSRHFDSDYQNPGIVIDGAIHNGGNTIRAQSAPSHSDYSFLGFNKWMPTRGPIFIPAGYGSGALELFILPDALGYKGHEDFLRGSRGDDRPGWEWGHTAVFTLKKVSDSRRFEAWTNRPENARNYSDINKLILNGTTHRFLAQLETYLDSGRQLKTFDPSIER